MSEKKETYYAGAFAVNPDLPPRFDDIDNADRPHTHRKWWGVPYIVENDNGDGYELRRLDGGAWDRSTFLGHFGTLDDAVAAAKVAQAESLRACPYCNTVSLARYWTGGMTIGPEGKLKEIGAICPVCRVEI